MTKSLLIVTVALGLAIAANEGFAKNKNEKYIESNVNRMVKATKGIRGSYSNDCWLNIRVRNDLSRTAKNKLRNAFKRYASKCYDGAKFFKAAGRANNAIDDLKDHPPRNCPGHSSHYAKTKINRVKTQANTMKNHVEKRCR